MEPSWHLAEEPRTWQREALVAWRDNHGRGVAAVVTGGGKTYFAFQCILEARSQVPGISTVILVPTLALLDQWYVSLQDDMRVPAASIAVYSGDSSPRQPADVNIVVINTARTRLASIAREPMLLIVDECHRAASAANSQVLRVPHAMSLGLSATPERDYDDLFKEVVVPAIGPVIYEYDYNRARRDGVIAPFELSNVRVALAEDEARQYAKLTRQIAPLFKRSNSGEAVDEQLHRLLRLRARVSGGAKARYPAALALVDRHRRERTIVFHEQIEAAEILTELLRARGHRVVAYHSGMGGAVRQDNLRMFRRGEVDVLVTCRALDEGINVPNASMAVIVASTASTRQRIQRLGRVLRPAPGKSRALIYTIFASEPEAERLRMEEERLEGAEQIRWLSMGARSSG